MLVVAAERLAIVLHTRQLVADIGLMLALGGGWTPLPAPGSGQVLRHISQSKARLGKIGRLFLREKSARNRGIWSVLRFDRI